MQKVIKYLDWKELKTVWMKSDGLKHPGSAARAKAHFCQAGL